MTRLPKFVAIAGLVAGALTSPSTSRASDPPGTLVRLPLGYYLDDKQVLEPRPVWRDVADGDFIYSIKREFPDSAAARLLAIAESCYPPRDLLIDIAATRYYEMGSDTAKTSLWWCDGPGVRRVAYAVTAGALDHYLRMTERFRHHDYLVPGGSRLWGTELVYKARIEARAEFVAEGKEFSQVYVATLSLAWAYDDGTFFPTFQAHRIVVLDPIGNVLSVVGDGRTIENVTFSSHRAIGRVDRVFR